MSAQVEQPPSAPVAGQDAGSSKHGFVVSVIISSFSNSSQARDWLVILVIGGILEYIRRVFLSIWNSLVSQFSITITMEDFDESYCWVMLWLSKQPQWTRAREMSISTHAFGLGAIAALVEGEGDNGSKNRIRFLPSYTRSASLWYRGHYLRVLRNRVLDGFYAKDVLTMKIFARDHEIVNQLLFDAKGAWKSAKAESVFIYASDTRNEWRFVASRPKRPLGSIVLDDGISKNLLDDAKDFLDSKKWYAERGIPFRRGYLLYGAPGTGKTSIIHSLAGELGLDVYIISLSRSTLDDNALHQLIADLPEQCIALMEDIDAAFHHSISRATEKQGEDLVANDKEQGNYTDRSPKISLSGLLNALDGVGAQEGRLLFATTNRYEALDPALRRPGRMDVHIEFKLASQHQASELFKRFYAPEHTTAPSDGESGKGSGYSCPPGDKKLAAIKFPVVDKRLQKELDLAGLLPLSEEFKAHVPDREISMAALQGYLMTHKGQPRNAVERVEVWVKKEMEKKKAKAKEVKGAVKETTSGRGQRHALRRAPTAPNKDRPRWV